MLSKTQDLVTLYLNPIDSTIILEHVSIIIIQSRIST